MRLLIILSIGWLIIRFRRWPTIMLVSAGVWHLLHLMIDGATVAGSTVLQGQVLRISDVSLFPLIIVTFLLDFLIRFATKNK